MPNSRSPFTTALAGLILVQVLVVVVASVKAAPQLQSITTTTTTTLTTTTTTESGTGTAGTSLIRLRSNRVRRPDSCRENLPRKSEDLPVLVITGLVKEVYLAGEQPQQQTALAGTDQFGSTSTTNSNSNTNTNTNTNSSTNKALVTIGRVIKGNQQLVGGDIIVSGFNSTSSTPCPNYVKPNDTLILLLEHEGDRKYSIQGNNLLSMNLNNLDRVNAVASDEPYRRRGPIEDILCEAHYCPYGRCVVVNEQSGQVACKCPDSCPALPTPVCGSDNATYANECHLIREGCRLKRPLFVTRETSC